MQRTHDVCTNRVIEEREGTVVVNHTLDFNRCSLLLASRRKRKMFPWTFLLVPIDLHSSKLDMSKPDIIEEAERWIHVEPWKTPSVRT